MKNIVNISASSTEIETLENIYSLFALLFWNGCGVKPPVIRVAGCTRD